MQSMTMYEAIRMVEEFRVAMEQENDPRLQLRLVEEESSELVNATNAFIDNSSKESMEDFLKEVGDLSYVTLGLLNAFRQSQPEDIEELLDQGTTLEMKIADEIINDAMEAFLTTNDLQEVIVIIHASNMSKLGDDGKPVRRDDGKIMKGPNYKAPDLSEIADRVFHRYEAFMTEEAA